MSDWRKAQHASRLSAVDLQIKLSPDLTQRIGAFGGKLYVIDHTLIVSCPSQDSISECAVNLGSDIRNELIESGCKDITQIEFWHELTNAKYVTPVVYRR